jgi:excisionase family DNA binding protein
MTTPNRLRSARLGYSSAVAKSYSLAIKTLDEAAVVTGLGRRTLQRWITDGKLTGFRVFGDRKRYVDLDEVARLRQPKALPRRRR